MTLENKKREKTKQKIFLFFLFLLLIAIDYPFINNALKDFVDDYEMGVVEKITDGDTIVVNGSNVRLLGINTPERGEKYYREAKSFLESEILNKAVKLARTQEDEDMYGRKLRYVILENKNINEKLIRQGLANAYFPSGKDKNYNSFMGAWQDCLDSGQGLCEKSGDYCGRCIKIRELKPENDEIVLENNCKFYCSIENWTLKDEGRKNFMFKNFILEKEVTIKIGNGTDSKNTLFWGGEDYVLTRNGDSIFLRDKENMLVDWKNY